MTGKLFGMVFVFVLGVSKGWAQVPTDPSSGSVAVVSDVVRLPASIHLSDDGLREQLEGMLETSATFRRQCRQIAGETMLRITLSTDPRLESSPFRARSTFRRFGSGLLIADVQLSVGDQTEWLAHEFEHVIEQIERRPLRWLAGRTPEVWQSGDDMFETRRAIRAGQTVRQEVHESRRLARTTAAWDRSERGDR